MINISGRCAAVPAGGGTARRFSSAVLGAAVSVLLLAPSALAGVAAEGPPDAVGSATVGGAALDAGTDQAAPGHGGPGAATKAAVERMERLASAPMPPSSGVRAPVVKAQVERLERELVDRPAPDPVTRPTPAPGSDPWLSLWTVLGAAALVAGIATGGALATTARRRQHPGSVEAGTPA